MKRQYEVLITAIIEEDSIEYAGTRADELCDIMVADGPCVVEAEWDEIAAAVGEE